MNNTYPIGTPLTFVWRFLKPNNEPYCFVPDTHTFRLRYYTGRGSKDVSSFMLNATHDAITWTLPAEEKLPAGSYSLVLDVFAEGLAVGHFHYKDAFTLYKSHGVDIPDAEQTAAGGTITLLSVAEFQHFAAGESAYQIAVQHGYEGTEEEWLNDPVNGIKGNGIKSVEIVGEYSSDDSAENTYRITPYVGDPFDFKVKNGKGIASVQQTTTSTESDGINIITVAFSDGTTATFQVKNGARGNSGYSGAAEDLEVVNDLDADDPEADAAKALSAYQGYVLGGKVAELGQKLLNNSLKGAGQTYVLQTIYGLIPGHTYRLYLKNPNWDMTGITDTTTFRFLISNYYNNASTARLVAVYVGSNVEPYYDITIPENSDYIIVGGRAAAGVDVEFSIIDYTDLRPHMYDTGWPKKYGKEDCIFEGKTKNNRYTYIFPVNDNVRVLSYLPDGYEMIAATYKTYESARINENDGRTYFGSGYSGITSSASTRPIKIGDTSARDGYMAFHINNATNTALSDADIDAIRSGFQLEFYPISTIVQIRENDKNALLANDQSVGLSLLWPYISSSSGIVGVSLSRIKFFDMGFSGRKLISVDISSLLTTIPQLVYNFGVWSTLAGAESNASATLLEVAEGGWKSSPVQDYPMYSSGYFSFYLKKSDDTAFTFAEFEAIRSGLVFLMENMNAVQPSPSVISLEEELPFGTFTREEGTGASLTPSTTIVSASETCVPHLGVTYLISLPSELNARFVYGTDSRLGTTTSWLEDGDEVTLPTSALIQRLQFKKADDSALTLEEMATFISSGLVKIRYSSEDLPIAQRNYDAEKYVKAALYRLGFADSADVIAHAGLNDMPIFVHISDLHGDTSRARNAAQYAKLLDADAIVATGDAVVYSSPNGSTFLLDAVNGSGIPLLTAIGNHEVSPKETYDNSDIYGWHISPFIPQGGYLESSGTPTTANYYYVDFDTKKLRLIVLNQYDDGCYIGEGLGGRLGQTQVTWFLTTLLSTPAGYGVIIAMHSPEDKIDTPETLAAWNQTINWDGRSEDQYGYCVNGIYVNAMRPIKTIIDAFIQKTAISTSYEENTVNGNTGGTVTISADFSTLADGVEFICYLCGHRHKDNVGYYHSATVKQLCINIVTSNCHYPRVSGLSFAEGTDLPRGDKGVTQDAFNVIAIDRQNGRVKIARVGSSVNFEGIERKFLLAPYKD